jgi:RNA polymerase sigma-70 factor (ECF subfamily)
LTLIMDAAPSSAPEEGVSPLSPLPVVVAATGGTSVPALAVLTRRMAAGAEDAFREFHAAWFQRLFRYVFVLMRGDEAAACDVTQETLLRVVRHVRGFEGEDEFWGWLTCLARSAAADHGRKASRYRRLLEKFSGQAPPPVPEPAFDPDEVLQRGLAQLSAEDRALLQQKYSGGSSVRQMAERAGVSESAIESRLARARRELRAIIFRITD